MGGRGWRCSVALVIGWIICGVYIAWISANLGRVPHYSDTTQYTRAAKTLQGLNYHGVGYPAFIKWALWNEHAQPLLRWEGWEKASIGRCAAPDIWIRVQLAQLVLWMLVVSYAAWVFFPQLPRAVLALVAALVITDPLLAHYQLALFTNGLSATLTLLVIASLVDVVSHRHHGVLSFGVLFLGVLAGSLVRVERPVFFLLATTLIAVCLWSTALSKVRVLAACLCVALAISVSVLVQMQYKPPLSIDYALDRTGHTTLNEQAVKNIFFNFGAYLIPGLNFGWRLNHGRFQPESPHHTPRAVWNYTRLSMHTQVLSRRVLWFAIGTWCLVYLAALLGIFVVPREIGVPIVVAVVVGAIVCAGLHHILNVRHGLPMHALWLLLGYAMIGRGLSREVK